MNAPRRKAKHEARRAHQREQSRKKKEAIKQAQYEAEFLGKDGRKLKKPRTGDAYDKAFTQAMKNLGYELVQRTRKVRVPGKSDGKVEHYTTWRKTTLYPESLKSLKKEAAS